MTLVSPKRGDVATRSLDDGSTEELACFLSYRRSSLWISRDAQVRRRYHDTDAWSDVIAPTCRESDGCLVTACNMRLERALALAWNPCTDGTCAALIDPVDGLTASNVCWRNKAHQPPVVREAYIPPSVQRALDAAMIADGDIKRVVHACGVSEATVWNYLAKGAARAPLPFVDAAVALVPSEVRRQFDALEDTRGDLRTLVANFSDDATPATIPHLLNMVRVLRCRN